MTSKISQPITNPCSFEKWHFDPTDGQLNSKQSKTRLQPRLAQLLSIFLANTNTLLSRETLIEMLWKDKAVNEDALSRCIAQLRAALGDSSSSPLYIETVPKKGYRFIAILNTDSPKVLKNRIIKGFSVFTLLLILIATASYTFYSNDISTTLQQAINSAQRITADAVREHQPEISNKGDKIAYAFNKDKRLAINIINQLGETLHTIEDKSYHLYSPTFSGDDQSILVVRTNGAECKIFIYHLPVLNKELLTDCFIPNSSPVLDWSDDGKIIVYVMTDNLKYSVLWLYDTTTQVHRQLTTNEFNIYDSSPRISPDGKYIAFTRGTSSFREIFILNLISEQSPIKMTNDKNSIAGIDWLKDSQHLVYDNDELGERSLWLLNTLNKEKTLLGAKDAQYPTLNKDNTLLIYQQIRYNAIIWSLDLTDNKAQATKIIDSIKYNNHAAFSPDGQEIAFSSNRQGKSAIWLYSKATKQQSKFLAIPGLNIFMPFWSSDGSRLLVSTRSKSGYQCLEVNAKTGEYAALIIPNQQYSSCIYTENDNIFVMTKDTDQPTKILKYNPVTTTELLIQADVSRIQASGIGSIIYSLKDKNGLHSIDTDGNNKKILIQDFNYRLEDHWTVQGQYLYYVVVNVNEGRGVWRYDLITSTKEIITAETPSAIGMTLAVNPDHSQLLITKTESRLADILMANIKP